MVPKYMQPEIEILVQHPLLAPVRAHPSDAGADLKSIESMTILPGKYRLVDTGVAIKIPVNYVGLVFSRSGQGKLRVALANSVGVIDSEYRGNIKVILTNDGTEPYCIESHDTKIAQLVIVPVMLPKFVLHDINTPWLDTKRGINGFGSTDKGTQ